MGNSIKILKNAEDLSQYFVQQIKARIGETLEGNFFTIALSGGSTPRSVFQYMANNFREQIEWNKILVFWSDERCVAPESEESNFRMANESLFEKAPIPANHIFRIKGETEPSEEAARYAELVQLNVTPYNEFPEFDFLMLGLGDDGHTASIFPGHQKLFNSDRFFEVAEHPITKQKRITATGKLINHARTVAFLVTGENKSEIVAQILERRPGWEKLPASLVQPENGELLWLLDEKAAKKLFTPQNKK